MADRLNVPLLSMENITKAFGPTRALRGVDLTLHRGQVLGLIGENGAGKSTIIKILSGAYHKDGGTIRLDGQEVEIGSPRVSQNLGISTIYQELTLFPDLNAVENILIGREPVRGGLGNGPISPLDRSAMRRAAHDIVANQLGVEIDLKTPVRNLSLAEKQLVEIARCLYSDAQIIIMDEPTEALEAAERVRLFEIIERLSSSGRSVIYVSHLLEELIRVADAVLVMRDGANVSAQPVKDVTVTSIIGQMVGQDLGEKYADKPTPTDEIVLQVHNLSRKGRFKDVSFDLHRGEILGVAGLAGAGKVDLVRGLFRARGLTSGKVELNGAPFMANTIGQAKALGFGLMPGDRKSEGLFLDKSLEWNTTIAGVVSAKGGHLNISQLMAATRSFSDSMSIKASGGGQAIRNLSGGNQQKAMLARWLLTKPHVLVLEEPTRGVDVKSKAEIYRQITAAAREGMSFIIVSADSPELLGLCNRILVMHAGQIAATLDGDAADERTIAYYSVQDTSEES